jgi:hypothetical protein
MVGACLNAWLANYSGQLAGIRVPCVLAVIGAAILASSVYIAMFLVGRFLYGVTYIDFLPIFGPSALTYQLGAVC